MRRLIYIPIIHTDADMGSLALALGQSTAALCGKERWEKHQTTTATFWQMVAEYLAKLNIKGAKVYQDGFASDGELGRKIIEEGMRRGSKNYEIILNLLNRGAEIVSTEDKILLEEEYRCLNRLICAETQAEKRLARKQYEARKTQLTEERDRFMARRINETLGNGEVGLLFLGAYHDVTAYLAPDIVVEQFKEREKVQAYFTELMLGHSESNLAPLRSYLTAEPLFIV